MVRRRLMFTFTQDLIKEPVIYTMGQQFNIVTNIQVADIEEDRGWAILELEGSEEDIEQGIAWATSRGMRVEPAGLELSEE